MSHLQLIRSCQDLVTAHELCSDLHPLNNTFLSNKLIEMYGRLGDVNKASEIFDRIRHKDSYSWLLLLCTYIKNGHLHKAKQTFDQTPPHTRIVSSWNAMLAALSQHGYLEQARELFDYMPQRDMVTWNAMLSAYTRNGHLEQAKVMFDTLPSHNLISWNAMLSAYSQSGYLTISKRLFDLMPARDLVSFTTLLDSYARQRHLVDQCKEMFERMPEWDMYCLTSMLSGLCNYSVELADSFFQWMPGQNLVSLTTMLVAYAEHGHPPSAKRIFDAMPEWDLVSCSAMLSLLVHAGRLAEVGSFLRTHSLPCSPSVLAAYAQRGHVHQTKRLFDSMPQRSLVSWNILLESYAQSGQLELAVCLFNEMPERDRVSWNAMLCGYAQHGLVREARGVFYHMPDRDTVSWNAMIVANTRNGFLGYGKKVFDGMTEPNVVSWTAMIVAYSHGGLPKEALRLFEEMKMVDSPDETSFLPVLLACCYCGKVWLGRSCFVSMQMDFGLSPSEHHYCCMVDLLNRAGHVSDAEDLFYHMPFVPQQSFAWRYDRCKTQTLESDAASYVSLASKLLTDLKSV